MKDKFNMTLEQNIFVAKRNIVDYIWKSANLEGITVTYPDTDAIFNNIGVSTLKVSEIVVINNLKYAWYFLIDNIEYPIDLNFICALHKEVGNGNAILNPGELRMFPVSIGGTSWKLDIPVKEIIIEKIKNINFIESVTERAITLMLYLMRSQVFNDGNKRIAMLAANHIMISHGKGIITIPIEEQVEFKKLLIKYYETNNMDDIKKFIYEKCIDGIPFENKLEDLPDYNLKKIKIILKKISN